MSEHHQSTSMVRCAHFLDNVSHPLQPAIIAIALLVWLAGAVIQIRFRHAQPTGSRLLPPPQFYWAVLVFLGIIGAEFALSEFIHLGALEENQPRLESPISSVTVNGKKVQQSPAIVEALRNMHSTLGHHSHPTVNNEVSLRTDGGPLTLDLRRDSGDPHEYWVFYRGFSATRIQEVGHAFTNALDGM